MPQACPFYFHGKKIITAEKSLYGDYTGFIMRFCTKFADETDKSKIYGLACVPKCSALGKPTHLEAKTRMTMGLSL